jgi:hypothetical protein
MTIERPMFPPRADGAIVQFPSGKSLPPAESRFAAVLADSGLEVVERQPSATPTSAEDYVRANASFEAWQRLPAMMKTLGEEWHDHGVQARTAYAMVTSPQSTMEGMHEEFDHADVDAMMANISRASEILKVTARFMDLTLLRMVAAATAVEARG